MSASPIARLATGHHSIPTRRVVIQHENEMPTDYGTTPGGTIFGTTPGGTRIIYDRAFLLQMRNSPLARTPPCNLPVIPGVTVTKAGSSPKKGSPESADKGDTKEQTNGSAMDSPSKLKTLKEATKEEEDQFDMDI